MSKKLFLLLTPFLFSSLIFANEINKLSDDAAFKLAVTQYNEIKNKRGAHQEILNVAKQVYTLGKIVLDKKDVELAKLAMTYGSRLSHGLTTDKKIAVKVINHALSIFKENYGENSSHLIQPTLALAKSQSFNNKAKQILLNKQAVSLAKKQDNPLLVADTLLNIGINYSSLLGVPGYSKRAKSHLKEAVEIYQHENSPQVAQASFWLGKYYLAHQKYNNAIINLNLSQKNLTSSAANNNFKLATHAFLVNAYSHIGNNEEATKHCIAIGKNRIWDMNSEPEPLFRIEPKYPVKAARRGKGGSVKMSFIIDKQGFVTDIDILENQGHRDFKKAAKDALKQWRYAPKFESGQAISTDATVLLSFHIG